MKRGDLVSVRTFSDGIVPRRIVENAGKTIYICTEEEWVTALNQKREPGAVGFKREYILGKVSVSKSKRESLN